MCPRQTRERETITSLECGLRDSAGKTNKNNFFFHLKISDIKFLQSPNPLFPLYKSYSWDWGWTSFAGISNFLAESALQFVFAELLSSHFEMVYFATVGVWRSILWAFDNIFCFSTTSNVLLQICDPIENISRPNTHFSIEMIIV